MRTRLLVVVAAAAAVAALAPGRAAAHALDVTVKVFPGVVAVEVGFDDGTPAERAGVVVTDAAGAAVARGETDERGVWRLARPAAGRYLATVEALGHRTRVEFEVAEGAGEASDFASRRPDRTLGLVLGVGGLLAASFAFWWLRLRGRGSGGT